MRRTVSTFLHTSGLSSEKSSFGNPPSVELIIHFPQCSSVSKAILNFSRIYSLLSKPKLETIKKSDLENFNVFAPLSNNRHLQNSIAFEND